MKIAHVVRRISFSDWGGTEQVVWNLARAQRDAGHDVRLFATDALGGPAGETRDGLPIARFHPVYPWWPMPRALRDALDRKGGNPFVPGLARALREWRPDVVHCHAMGRIAELCIRVAAGLHAKSVISLHGGAANVPAEEAKSLRAPTRGRLPWGKLVETALHWKRRVPEDAGGIVCVGADEYAVFSTRHPHVLWLPNGVDPDAFAPPPGTPRREPDPDDFRLLCVARIDRQKNQLALVEALARHPRIRLRLVGPVTQPDYLETLQARARELGVADRLCVVGPLPPGSVELREEYLAADAFALASRHEPFGIAVLEAWAAGLPVAASRVGGLGRLCGDHPDAALVFDPASPDSLDAALRPLLDDPAARRALANAAPAAARAYRWSAIAARLDDFLQTLPS